MKTGIAVFSLIIMLFFTFSTAQGPTPRLLEPKTTIDEDTIWLQGAGVQPEIATVTLEATSTGDAHQYSKGTPVDLVLAVDLSGSMDGIIDERTRIEWVKIAGLKFLDTLSKNSRNNVAIFGWTSVTPQDYPGWDGDDAHRHWFQLLFTDTSNANLYHQSWFNLSNDFESAKSFLRMDIYLDENSIKMAVYDGKPLMIQKPIAGSKWLDNTPLRISAVKALDYLKDNSNAQKRVLVLLTDGSAN
ncbi:MAG: hypothetical protein ABIA63_09040, partial [bacterium]